MTACPFCAILTGDAPALVEHVWPDAIAIIPLNPVVKGHLLVIPRIHVADATENPDVAAAVMRRAAEIAPYPSNIITSAGPAATQSVRHLHLHVVPRDWNDGLALPWADGRRTQPTRSTDA